MALVWTFYILKHLGFAEFPITIGSSFSPAAITKNAHVFHCFAFFFTTTTLFFSLKVLSGNPRQKAPVSSMFQLSSGFHPLAISLALSHQLSTVSLPTSASSPAIDLLQIPCCFLNDSNQPFGAENPVIPNFSAIRTASLI